MSKPSARTDAPQSDPADTPRDTGPPPGRDCILFTVDGKEYGLRWDLGAIDRLETANGGTPYQTVLNDVRITQHVSLRQLKMLVWAGLEEKHRMPKPDGDGIVSPAHVDPIINAAPGNTLQEKILFLQEVAFKSFLCVMLAGDALKVGQKEISDGIQTALKGLRAL